MLVGLFEKHLELEVKDLLESNTCGGTMEEQDWAGGVQIQT